MRFVGNGSPWGDVVDARRLDAWTARIDQQTRFELWAAFPQGPSMCMLREREDAWLMYLRHDGDSGFTSIAAGAPHGTCEVATFTLGNGQVDDYPVAWCIGTAACYSAVRSFFATGGARPTNVLWQDAP